MEETDQSHAQADLLTEKRPGIHWLGNCVVPGDGLDIVEEKKNSFPLMGLEIWVFQPIV